MTKPLRAGIVGYGYMGEIRKAVIERNPRLQLVGISDTNPAAREKIRNCEVYGSYEELLRKDLDVVFVCTPNHYSPEISIKSMYLGKHVFCEKPPGCSVQDISDIAAAETANPGVKLMFGFNHRFHPGIIKAKALVESGRLGKVINMRGLYGKSGGINFRNSWRNDRQISGGGILLDQGIHMLDLFRHFCGDFESVKCFISSSYWKFNVEDNAYVILQHTGGQNAFFHSSATMWKHTFKIDITLEDGYITVEGLLSKTGSYGRERIIIGRRQFEDEATAVGNPSEEMTHFDRDMSWDLEVEEFVKCVEQGIPVRISSSEDALKVMEIIEQAYADGTGHLMKERV